MIKLFGIILSIMLYPLSIAIVDCNNGIFSIQTSKETTKMPSDMSQKHFFSTWILFNSNANIYIFWPYAK